MVIVHCYMLIGGNKRRQDRRVAFVPPMLRLSGLYKRRKKQVSNPVAGGDLLRRPV